MGADAAITVAIERGGIAAVAAVTFASDEIHELGFLSLLHSPSLLIFRLSGGCDGSGQGAERSSGESFGRRRRSLVAKD